MFLHKAKLPNTRDKETLNQYPYIHTVLPRLSWMQTMGIANKNEYNLFLCQIVHKQNNSVLDLYIQ